ncbi:MAG: tannase/feruloyl esterase family alpha/beta hydrolase [Betaproteobacteria bacterium]|nr:tannase/feruloyl esterase family alpha/beta hydrolase [Betaproteobacteria bacterium]
MTFKFSIVTVLSCTILSACSLLKAGDSSIQLKPAASTLLNQCDQLSKFNYPHTAITSARMVASGGLTNAGQPVSEHCLVSGQMNRRISSIDGETYAIGFEMRLPIDWGGRFLYQANGGTDGFVVTADGGASLGSGGVLRNGLQLGFAVISSDAGHNASQNPLFGRDPQARLDYGYQAIGSLTPMAKALIKAAYGKEPDRSYIAGTSNGGRQALVAASRYPEHYDGILANAPGIYMPRASVANLSHVKRWDSVASTRVVNGLPDYESSLPMAERQLIASAILERCDALDGMVDGLVQDTEACRSAFNLNRDIPTCKANRDGTCLSAEQKNVINAVYAPVKLPNGEQFYPGFPYDPGIAHPGWGEWKFRNSVRTARNPVSVGFIFSTPPSSRLRQRGGKIIVVHGTADPIFSIDDTAAWYRGLDIHHGGQANRFARFFPIPGMGHSRGGPATDQFDALSALVDWVEYGKAPDQIFATVRGAGNRGGLNPDIPSSWPSHRSRPLCPYPLVARYQSGDKELAASYACVR